MARDAERRILAHIKATYPYPAEIQSRTIHRDFKQEYSQSYVFLCLDNLALRKQLIRYNEGERIVYFTLPDPSVRRTVKVPSDPVERQALLIEKLHELAPLISPGTNVIYFDHNARTEYNSLAAKILVPGHIYRSNFESMEAAMTIFGPTNPNISPG